MNHDLVSVDVSVCSVIVNNPKQTIYCVRVFGLEEGADCTTLSAQSLENLLIEISSTT